MDKFNQVMEYIEQHLEEEIDYDKISKIACCCAFHFQRMFSYMTGISLTEYVRRRKMTKAGFDLQNSKEKIIDIALKYGYQSPTAFNRAFQSVHGIAPSCARKEGVCLNAFYPILFQMVVKGVQKMQYKICNKKSFSVAAVSMKLEKDMEKNFQKVPLFWQEVQKNGTLEVLKNNIKKEPVGILGISDCCGKDWKYFIGVATEEAVPEGMEEIEIPEGTWAVFSGKGKAPEAIQELEKKVFTQWLPYSGYEYAQKPDIEVYYNQNPEDALFEVWICVVKK